MASSSSLSSFSSSFFLESRAGATASIVLLVANALIYILFTSNTLPPLPRGGMGPDCVSPAFSRHAVEGRSLYYEKPRALSSLRESFRDKWIHLTGDSTLRETFYEMAALLKREPLGAPLTREDQAKRQKNKHVSQMMRIGSTKLTFSWRPYCVDLATEWNTIANMGSRPNVVIMTCGLHDLLYGNETSIDQGINHLQRAIAATHSETQSNGVALLFKTSSPLVDSQLTQHRLAANHFRDENLVKFNSRIYGILNVNKGLALADGHALVSGDTSKCDDDGIHSTRNAITTAMSIATFAYCTIGVSPFFVTPSQLALLIVFLPIAFIFLYSLIAKPFSVICKSSSFYSRSSSVRNSSGYAPVRLNDEEVEVAEDQQQLLEMGHRRTHKEGEIGASHTHDHPQSANTSGTAKLERLPSSSSSPSSFSDSSSSSSDPHQYNWFIQSITQKETSQLLWALFQLGTILFFVYLMDGDHRISWPIIGDKTYVRDTFIFICLLLLFFAMYTIKPSNSDEILNRDQTEEWKGWMQILFVLYHYFAAKEMYNMIRIFIAAYVWMTGYGNFLFFQKQKDYSFTRLAKMLFRLNFFVTFVCIVMNREFMQYYVCALHTTFFLMVYFVMWIKSEWNTSNLFLFFKFLVCFIALLAIFDWNVAGIFEKLFGWNPLFLLNNSLHEWRFRSTLDHFATLLGMVCAWQLPRFVSLLQYIEQSPIARRYSLQASIAIAMIAITAYWWITFLLLPKSAYNAQHPYTSHIPILAFIVLRNIHPTLRKYVLFMFTWCGKITLETYILQFHIWLSDDAATIVHYIQGYPLINFVFATTIYIATSKATFELTTVISDALIPRNVTTEQLCKRLLWIATGWWTLVNICKIGLLSIAQT